MNIEPTEAKGTLVSTQTGSFRSQPEAMQRRACPGTPTVLSPPSVPTLASRNPPNVLATHPPNLQESKTDRISYNVKSETWLDIISAVRQTTSCLRHPCNAPEIRTFSHQHFSVQRTPLIPSLPRSSLFQTHSAPACRETGHLHPAGERARLWRYLLGRGTLPT